MADPGFVTVGKKGKGKPKEDDEDKNEEKRLRDEGKIMVLRFERAKKDDQYYDHSGTADAIIKSIVNGNEDVILCAKDGSESVDDVDKIKSDRQWAKYYEMNIVNLAKTRRYAFTIKIRTDNTRYHDIKYKTETFNLLKKENFIIHNHKLSEKQHDVRLAFNVLFINPYLVNKDVYGKMIDAGVKKYVKDSNGEKLGKLGVAFVEHVKYTKENLVEISTRLLKANYDSKKTNQVEFVESVVLTVNVEYRWMKQIKDIIKALAWDVKKYGKFFEENPSKTDNLIYQMCEHNELCNESAYVKVQWLPKEIISHVMRFPDRSKDTGGASMTFEKYALTIEKKNEKGEFVKNDKGEVQTLIRSINTVKEQLGMHFFVTTKKDLEKATKNVTYWIEKLSKAFNFKEDAWNVTMQNPEQYTTMVVQKASSKAESEISAISNGEQKVQIDEDDPRLKTKIMNNSGKRSSRAPPPRHITTEVISSTRSYAQAATGQTDDSNKEDDDELSDSEEEERKEKARSTMDTDEDEESDRKIKATQAARTSNEANTGQTNNNEILQQLLRQVQELKDSQEKLSAKLEEVTEEKNNMSKENEELRELNKRLMSNDESEDEVTTKLFQGSEYFESPMPVHKSKRSKDTTSGMKRVSMSTNVTTQHYNKEEPPTTSHMDTEEENDERKMEESPPKQQKTDESTSISPAVQQMNVTTTPKKKEKSILKKPSKPSHPEGGPSGQDF